MQFVKFRLNVVREILQEIGGKLNNALSDQIQGAIDGIDSQAAPNPSLAVTVDEAILAIAEGKIPAIRKYRERTNAGLLESKQAIERCVPQYLMDMRHDFERLKEKR